MQTFWVTVNYDADLVLTQAFETATREEAVEKMLEYLRLEFELPVATPVNVTHR